jgi:hypothetical protein
VRAKCSCALLRDGAKFITVSTDLIGIPAHRKIDLRMMYLSIDPVRLAALGRDCASGKLSLPPISRVWLSETAKVHGGISQARVPGKLVLIPRSEF